MVSLFIFFTTVVALVSRADLAPVPSLIPNETPIAKDNDAIRNGNEAFREKYKDILHYVVATDSPFLEGEIADEIDEDIADEIEDIIANRTLTPETEPVDEIPAPGTFQADMMFVPEQWAKLANKKIVESDPDVTDDVGQSTRRKKRTAVVSYRDYYWPFGIIPIRFHLDNSADTNAAIKAMMDYGENTCIQFVYYTEEVGQALGHHTYLDFVSGLQGCWSFVGRVVPSNQTISVGKGCGQVGTLVHEIGHAIGLFHEQSRPDRDFFVEILYEHIRAEDRVQFYKYPAYAIDTTNSHYDEESVMHYGTFAFSQDGLPTIVTKNPSKQGLIGQRNGLSDSDIQMINLIYNCWGA